MNRDNARSFSLRFPFSPTCSAPTFPPYDWPLQGTPVRSARRWDWQLWRIFFIHVTCLRARKNTFSRSKLRSNQGN